MMALDTSPLRLVAACARYRPGAPWLLDLFCGAGGAGMGYWRAGFNVLGVDIERQPRYPFWFVQSDALEFVSQFGEYFDAIHASPPCQEYSKSAQQWRLAGKEYPDLIEPSRDRLIMIGVPYIIENVIGAPLNNPIFLNGSIFGINIHKPRLFECSFPIQIPLPTPYRQPVKMGRVVQEGDVVQPVGHFSGVDYVQREMGCEWMNQYGLSQSIPPAFTEYIGHQLMNALKNERVK